MTTLKLYQFDSQYNLKLLQGVKLPHTCNRGLGSQTYKGTSILFSCRGKNSSRYYLLSINNDGVSVDHEELDAKYKRCTWVHTTGKGISGIVYFACLDMSTQFGVIFAVFDGPLQFKIVKEIPNSQIVNQLQMLTQGTRLDWDPSRKYTAVVMDVHAHSYTVIFVARIYDMTDPLKPRYNSSWVVPFSIASMDNIPDKYQQNHALGFARKINHKKVTNNYIKVCAMNGILIVIDSTPGQTKVIGLRSNYTRINFKNDFVIGYDIKKAYCETETNLIFLFVKGNGKHYGDLSSKAFILKLTTWRKASSRFFGSYLRPNKSKAVLISQVDPTKLAVVQMMESASSEQDQDLGPSTTLQKKYNFVGTIAPVDLPQFWLNLTNTPTANYSLTFQVLSVCGGETEITIPFSVFRPKTPTIKLRNTTLDSQNRSENMTVDNGGVVQKFMKNEINLSEKLSIQGAITDVEFDKDQNFEDDLYLRMELLMPVNFGSYLVQDDSQQGRESKIQVVDNNSYMFFLDGAVFKYNVLNGTRFQPNLGVKLFDIAMEDDTYNYVSLAYIAKKSFVNGVKVIHHFFVIVKILQKTAMFEEIHPILAVTIISTTEDPAYKEYFNKPGQPSTMNIPDLLLKRVDIALGITYNSNDFKNLMKSDFLEDVVEVGDNEFVMLVPNPDKTALNTFKFSLQLQDVSNSSSSYSENGNQTDDTANLLTDRKWSIKNLITINEISLGMSGFSFNDYRGLGISGELELHLLLDSRLISLQIHPDYSNPVITQVAQINELDIPSKMKLMDCFKQGDENSQEYQISSPIKTSCIIASDSADIHEIIIQRKLESVWPTETGTKQVTPKIAKIANITRNGAKKYIFPSTRSPEWIYTGYNYFLARAKDARFMLVYKTNATEYAIGSIWRSYQSNTSLAFAKASDTEYIVMKTQGYSGKVFHIFNNLRLRIFNDIKSLENVTLIFNTRATTHVGANIADSFGPVNLTYSLLEYKEARGIKDPDWTNQGRGLVGSLTQNFFKLYVLCFICVVCLICLLIACVKESGKMSSLKKDFKRLKLVKKKMKRREQYELELQSRRLI